MPPRLVHSDLIEIALDRVEGFEFERFINSFYPAIVGRSFVPLGGVKDGGADGVDEAIYEDVGGASSFYQASVGVEVDGKIRRTFKRLAEFGRSPKRITYVTSQRVRYLDTVESALTEELGVSITIRDASYIASHINDGPQTVAAFEQHLMHLTDFLKAIGASNLVSPSAFVRTPEVFVFLGQELARKHGDYSLVNSVVDTLILWGLEGTDPDLGKFLDEAAILERICAIIPSVRDLVRPRLRARLVALAAKGTSTGRQVRWHKAEDLFCLPFETRQAITSENATDEYLLVQVRESLLTRMAGESREGLGEAGTTECVAIAMRTLQLTFEREGLQFAAYLARQESEEFVTIVDSINAALDEAHVSGKRRPIVAQAVFEAVRGVLYDSSEAEQEYLRKLSRTYALLFTLNTEPKLIEYFQAMAGDFYLYVGADQIIKAMSEHYLARPDQVTRNTLNVASAAGATLVLTEPVLEEVVWNLRTSNWEFLNTFGHIESKVSYELARNCPKILVRAYLYANMNESLGRRRPVDWRAFVNQFCDYNELHGPSVFDALRRYLQNEFSMKYRTHDDLLALPHMDKVADLAARLKEFKSDELAENDAMHVFAVYGHRQRAQESAGGSEFGFRSWWLTAESRLLKYTADIIDDHSGARYIMRPDFLLNYLALAPSASEARDAFHSIFPSILGMSLARRMPEAPFKKMISNVTVAESLDDARRGAAMARYADQLKADFEKQYLQSPPTPSSASGIDAIAARDHDRGRAVGGSH